jgi:colanic acid/amylovoran biosynthesis glycosyltransferase
MGTLQPPVTGRIAYLISQYPTYSHTFILREIRQLRTMGWDIQTISIRPCDRPLDKLTPEEAEEHQRTLYVTKASPAKIASAHLRTFLRRPLVYIATAIYAMRMGHGGFRKLLYFAEAVVVGVWMEQRRLTHAHVHFASTVALIMHKLFGLNFSATIHGSDEFIDPAGFCLTEKIQAAAFIIGISKYGRSQLMRSSSYEQWHKLEVCRLGIDPDAFEPDRRAPHTGPFRLITVGRLVPVKGYHVLIAALTLLKERGRHVRLSLVGDGPDRSSLERHVADAGLAGDVSFEGSCNQDRVKSLYNQADAFVLTSFAEGVPVVLMEAMSMGVPSIATNITGVPELVTNGVHGILVTPSDEEDLAGAIISLMDNPDMRARFAKEAREKVSRDFNLRRNTGTLSSIFNRRLRSGTAGLPWDTD